MSVRPCRHPECRDVDGNRRITDQGLCERCLPRAARLLADLGEDYVRLAAFPAPRWGAKVKVAGNAYSFGHPAEWASDLMTRIADSLDGFHDNLADNRREARPSGPRRQAFKVTAALAYLQPRVDQLARAEWCEDAIVEWLDLHREVQRTLGLTMPRDWLPAPCWGCDSEGLYLDRNHADTVIRCPACGWSLPEEHFGLYARAIQESHV